MALSKEELLIPRYKVIADWPGVAGKVCVGDIFQPDPEDEGMFWIDGEPFQEDKLRDYPHLFIKLEWWEERKPEDMPDYLLMNHQSKKVMKAIKHNIAASNGNGFVNEEGNRKSYVNYLPATKEEYEAYNSQKQTP